ncbi:hypothetical protein D3C72_1416490 [compost metagenome]
MAPLELQPRRLRGDADDAGQRGGELRHVFIGPDLGAHHALEEVRQHRALGGQRRVGGGQVAEPRPQAAPADKHAGVSAGLRHGRVRFPGRPGIDGAVGQRELGIGRRQEADIRVLGFQPGRRQRLQRHEMANRTPVRADALALEVGRGLQRRIGAHEDGGAVRVGPIGPDQLDPRTRREREDCRRIANRPAIHGAGIERLGQRRGGRELGPLDVIANALERIGGFEQRAQAALLIPRLENGARLPPRGGNQRGCSGKRGAKAQELAAGSGHRNPFEQGRTGQ